MKKLILYVIGSLSIIAVSLMTINVIFSDKSNYQTIENVESKTEETIQEKSLEISFDDENLKYMASVIYGSSNFLLEADNGELNQSNLDISKKEFIALSQCDSKDCILAPREELKYKDIAWYVDKSKIDEQMLKIFGTSEYDPVDFQYLTTTAKYDSDKNVFWTIGDGGGPNSYPVIGIYKVDKYNDRYELFVKYLYVENMKYQDKGYGWIYKITSGGNSKKILDYYKTEGIGPVYESITEFKTIKELCEDVSIIKFVKNDRMISNSLSERDMLLSKYYDDATEYKVTFLINGNGAIHWQKTELLK